VKAANATAVIFVYANLLYFPGYINFCRLYNDCKNKNMKKLISILLSAMLLFAMGCDKIHLQPVEKQKLASDDVVANSIAGLAVLTPTAPTLPTGPTIPSRVYNVSSYGAVPNDGVDDRAKIQNAVDALTAAGGGTLEFPSGTYNITINPATGQYKYAISLEAGKIRLRPQSGATVNLKLNNSQGAYYTIFNVQNAIDVDLENLTIDQNGLNNQIPLSEITGGDGGVIDGVGPRQILALSGAIRFKVNNCIFDNVMGVWVIFNSTGADGTITNNTMMNVGGGNYDYDVSVVYTDCDRALVDNNQIVGRATGAKGTRTAFETHGNDQTISNNHIFNMAVGVNVVGDTQKPGATSVSRHSYTGNKMVDVYEGFVFWTYAGFSFNDLVIQNSDITLDVDGWYFAGLQVFVAGQFQAPYGIGLRDWSGAVKKLKIADNLIKFSNYARAVVAPDFSSCTYAAGICLSTVNTTTVSISNLTCTGNTVNDAISAGYYSFVTINSALVSGNTFNNPGRGGVYSGPARYTDTYWDPYSNNHQSGVYVRTKQNSRASSFTISNNITNDSVSPDVVKFGANARATVSNTSCFVTGNTVTGASGAVVQYKGTGWN
jgi:hypothetical protein